MNYRAESEKRRKEAEAAEAARQAAEWEAQRPEREAEAARLLKVQEDTRLETEIRIAKEQALRNDYQRSVNEAITKFKSLHATEMLRKIQKELWQGVGIIEETDASASIHFNYPGVQRIHER